MTGIDTSVLVRYFAQDDEAQLCAVLSNELIVDRCRDMECKSLASLNKGMLKRHRGFVMTHA
jgi:hypothetical protein